jgi:hypothetical protein
MYGKHFTSMYEGSMIGKGSCFFAVWGYVLSHFVPDRDMGAQVELNPKLIAFVLGDEVKNVERVIREMCEPDSKSRSKEKQGKKLVKIGEYAYQVVNGEKYRAIRDEEKRREQNRTAQAKFREKNETPKTTACEVAAGDPVI